MVVEWFDEAQEHWIEQLDYCAKTIGESIASELIKRADEKIDRICRFPESGTREPLLKDKEQVFRYVFIRKRIKLIYRFDEELQTVYIEDVWNTNMDPQHLLEGMK
ncbi:MAG: type II toxin-antitoxin system RelE/ParE family toxin [Bacteroidales bacterium]|nr:type II toxin-antitoxin system RelE/ParE family toxin [Bacteroidales bacterium]